MPDELHMDRNPLISIIVPVYNSEKYLAQCLDSILNQGFKDFEVLLVDDGSTDGSGAICDEYALLDSRIRVFHKTNGGASSARNYGISHSNGEWITFVDSDDVLLANGLQELATHASDTVDMVWGGYELWDENNELKYRIPDRISEVLTNEEGTEMLFFPRYYRYLGYSVGRLFRRSVIVSSNISFDEDIFYNEDRLFCTRFMCSSDKGIGFTTTPVYGYIQRKDGAMGLLKKGFRSKFITDLTALIRMRELIFAKYPGNERLKELVDCACYASWRRMVGMKGYAGSPWRTRVGIIEELIAGIGIKSFFRFDWKRNRNRIRKAIRKYL